MKTLGLVITDGVGFRNYILSDFLSLAEKKFDTIIILSCLPAHVYKGHTTSRIIELDVFTEHFKTWFFRKTKEVAHLKLYAKDNLGIQDNLLTNTSKLKTSRGYATRFIYKLTTVFHSEKNIQIYQKLQNFTFSNNKITNQYKQLLGQINFDLLFFTHQRPPYIAPLVYAAKALKVKTATFIFSWDNLASKGRMAANFDYYLVWSNLMKQDLLAFYKTVKSKAVKVVGTPQFVPYIMDKYKMSNQEFITLFELNPANKTICFSCGDSATSKNDELYIKTIAQAIKTKKIEAVNLIVRTSPAEDPIRFKALVAQYPFIKWHFPKWEQVRASHQESWSQRIPSVQDLKELRALLEYCHLNINMLSTMSLDFMIFDKPVVNTVFGDDKNGIYNDQRFLGYKHIMHVVNSKASKIVKNEKELIQAINTDLKKDNNSINRKKLVTQQIGVTLEETSTTLVNALSSWM